MTIKFIKYDPSEDSEKGRQSSQLGRIYSILLTNDYTPIEICDLLGVGHEKSGSIEANIRNMRKYEYGGHKTPKVNGKYKLIPNLKSKWKLYQMELEL